MHLTPSEIQALNSEVNNDLQAVESGKQHDQSVMGESSACICLHAGAAS